MAATGGAASIPQSAFTPQRLAKQMQKMALEPGALENAAKRAKEAGYPDATRDLADLLIRLAGPTPSPIGPVPQLKEAFA